jgi:L-asparagine transporter-like permease
LTLFVLYLLALLDGLLCGLRTSMGRCPLIRKRAYYIRAALRGIAGAQIISTLALLALLLTAALSPQWNSLRSDLLLASARMLWIFLPYSTVVLANLALRLVPSADIRSATSVFMLGPLTAIRPLVMIAGVLYGISASHLVRTKLLGLFILALMLALEFVLNRRAARIQTLQIRQLI